MGALTSAVQGVVNRFTVPELGLRRVFRYVSRKGAPLELVADPRCYEGHIDGRMRQVLRLPARDIHRIYSSAVSRLSNAEATLPALATFFDCLNEGVEGIAVNGVQLILATGGLDTGTLHLAKKDRGLLSNTVLTVTTIDGRQESVAAPWLIKKYNDFIASTTSEERSVLRSDYTYKKWERIVAGILNNRAIIGPALKSAIAFLSPVLFEGLHGARVAATLPDMIDSLLADGNTVFLRMLIRNNQPLMLHTQYLEDVTTPEHGNAWQRSLALPAGGEITYAECMRALRDFCADEMIERYPTASATALARIGIDFRVEDPEGILEGLPERYVAVFSHRSSLDICFASTALFMKLPRERRRHSMIGKSEATINAGVGAFMLANQPLERISRDMPEERASWLRAWTGRAYEAILNVKGMIIFFQGTRSPNEDWKDLKERGDGIIEKKFQSAGMFVIDIARRTGVPIVFIHLENNGRVFADEKAHVADVFGLSKPVRLLLKRQLGNRYDRLMMPAPGVAYMGDVAARVLRRYDPLTQAPEDIINDMIEAYNKAEGVGPTVGNHKNI